MSACGSLKARQERRDLTSILKMQDRSRRDPSCQFRLDTGAPDSIELHDVPNKVDGVLQMTFLATDGKIRSDLDAGTSPDHAGGACQARRVEPDREVGSRQTEIEGLGCVVALADPGVSTDGPGDASTEHPGIRFPPARFPEQPVQVNDRTVQLFADGPSQCRLAAPGITQDIDSRHGSEDFGVACIAAAAGC